MDFESLKNQVSNISLYDIKAGFRKAQNAVMNYTEMEAKVREATNNEPWGCPNSTMQEISNGTFNYATLNEIMPMIYKRFTEKTAEEWRQIYKALQLLEFLIKNGSERVVDDARSHLSLLKMLRQFHYIDSNGKDQGINVRNRAKELAELLGDVERIRAERKKARSTRNKYGGVEGGVGIGGAGSSRFGGFGNEAAGSSSTYGGYSGGVYGDGGGFGGQSDDYDEGQTSSRRERFEEYDEYDEGTAGTSGRRKQNQPATSKPQPPKPKEPEVDLFDFGDDDMTSAAPAPTSTSGKQLSSAANEFSGFQSSTGVAGADDDDFDDFQSATQQSTISPTTTQFAAPTPMAGPSSNAGMNSILSTMSPPPQSTSTPSMAGSTTANHSAFHAPTPSTSTTMSSGLQQSMPAFQQQPHKPAGYQAATPNYFGSISINSATGSSATTTPISSTQSQPSGATSMGSVGGAAKKSATGADPFANLVIGGASAKKSAGAATKGPTMADMAKQRASAGIWGASGGTGSNTPRTTGGSEGRDLLG